MRVKVLQALVLVAAASPLVLPEVSMGDPGPTLVDFSDGDVSAWRPINDGVMGGISSSRLEPTGEGTAVFKGELSLENNGGFASVRSVTGKVDLSSCMGLEIRVRGDGREYQLRLRADARFDGISYKAEFPTEENAWQIIKIPFSDFWPTFRGQAPRNAPPLATDSIGQLGILLADGKPGSFALEIAWIRATGCGAGGSDP